MSWVQSRAAEMIARHGFLGVPTETFEDAGRRQFIALLNEGLCPESKVLDIGCGCLRVTYWLARFLDPGCYCGIEPARVRVEHGLHFLLTPDLMMAKQPRFDFNPHFDSSVFATKFDYFLAGSIWTHAGKSQIEATLSPFCGIRRRPAFSLPLTFRRSLPVMTIRAIVGSEPAMNPTSLASFGMRCPGLRSNVKSAGCACGKLPVWPLTANIGCGSAARDLCARIPPPVPGDSE